MADDRIRASETELAPSPVFETEPLEPLPTEKIPLTPQDRSWLTRQIDLWRRLGLVSDNQSRSILGLYEEQWESQGRTQNVAIFVLMSIAAFLVGLAVILLVAWNWQDMPKALKLAVLIGGVAGIHGTGFWMRFGKGWKTGSEVAFFFGSILYGAGIWLIAQIFNLDSHYPDGFWWWAWGILPFALLLDTVLIHTLLVGVLTLWVGTEILGNPRFPLFFFGPRTFPPPGAYTLPVFVFLPMLWAYRKNQVGAVWLYLPLVVFWASLQPVAWHFFDEVVFFLGALASLLLLAAELHPENSRFAIPYRLFGLLLLFGVLTPMSFWDFNRHMNLADANERVGALAPALGISFLGIVAIGAAIARGAGRVSELQHAPLRMLASRIWLPAGLTLAFAAIAYLHLLTVGVADRVAFGFVDSPARWTYALFVTLAANAFFLAASFWTMWTGLREERGLPFAGGVVAFLFWTILRYVDLFGEFGGMLGAALMFFLCGAVLFGVAFYWHNRKRARHDH